MGHSVEHHIEHAEHAAHAAHDTFNTRVTISIAIIAAMLAGVSILGHKAHNLVLLKQLEASMVKSEGFNKWAQFQAYNVRSHLYQIAVDEATFAAATPGAEKGMEKSVARWKGQVDKYETKSMPEAKAEAQEFDNRAAALSESAILWHHKAERLDLGDLGLQLGVVLASLAILTKRRAFWFLGIACAVIGLGVAMTGQMGVMLGSHDHGHAAVEHKSH
jgi:hypothetical protein